MPLSGELLKSRSTGLISVTINLLGLGERYVLVGVRRKVCWDLGLVLTNGPWLGAVVPKLLAQEKLDICPGPKLVKTADLQAHNAVQRIVSL